MAAINEQQGGDHYRSKAIQPVQFIAANNWDFFAGNSLKYITRFPDKGGLLDLKKALHYAYLRIELEMEKHFYHRDRRAIITIFEYIEVNDLEDEFTQRALISLDAWVMSSEISTNLRAKALSDLNVLISQNL